ncbi:MAG: EAL domain-containing protein [Gallionella sp.]
MTEKQSMLGGISRKMLSLRLLIPLLIVLPMILLLGFVFSQELRHESELVYEDYLAKQMATAMRLQASIERDVRLGLRDRLQQEFSDLSDAPEVVVAALADEHDQVIASTQLFLIGRGLAQVTEQAFVRDWLAERQAMDSQDLNIRQTALTESNAILSYAAVRLDMPGGSLGKSKLGKLLIYTDVTLPLAIHSTTLRMQLLKLLVSFISLALMLGILLHRIVTRRVGRLLRVAERVGDGNLNSFSGVDGPDEIGRLGVAFDGMVNKMARSSTQIRKLSRAVEQSQNTIIITDSEGIIEYVNPHFCQIFGYTPEEVIGKSMRMHQSDTTPKEVYDELWSTIKAGKIWNGELLNMSKQGKQHWEQISLSPIFDEQGVITHFLSEQIDINARKAAEERMIFLAHHDILTQLPNRILFLDRLQQAITYAERQHTKVALLFLDLDRFKNVNDMHGHHMGDLMLQEVARRICQDLRSSDTVSRQGGDEFIIMLPNLDKPSDIVQVIDKLIESIARPYSLANHTLHMTTSVGVSVYPQDGIDRDTLIKNADTAMYQSKEAGRNDYRFFTPEMNQAIAKRVGLENKLRDALEKGEFLLHYQPKVDLRSGEIIAVEALVRWLHPEDGLISPADFIPIAEDTGMIVPLGAWVLNEACRQNQEWRVAGLRAIVMAVNLSPVQFQERILIDVVQAALARSGMSARALELEITESAIMKNAEQAIAILDKLSKQGIKVSIDDFGTGYSSLSHLKKFSIDEIKIDQSFVRDLSVDKDDAAIISAIISMSKSLGLTVIAEGVETIEQLRFLKNLDCDMMQGYYFSKPLPADEFRKLLESERVLELLPS